MKKALKLIAILVLLFSVFIGFASPFFVNAVFDKSVMTNRPSITVPPKPILRAHPIEPPIMYPISDM